MVTVACSGCGAPVDDSNQYCGKCGSKANFPVSQFYNIKPPEAHTHGRGFGQMFGLDPRVAFLTLIVDSMLFGGDVITGGVSIGFSVLVGVALGFVTYKAQRKWYGDDKESALLKSVILGLLTAIPAPLPAILSVPSGILGLVHNLRKK
jgi:uncharacterized membrane protein YvlD (DUF360 family)